MKVINLKPTKDTVILSGSLSYGESVRAWNTIRFNKSFINEFSMLKQKREKFGYKIELYRNYPAVEKAIRKLKESNEVIPILLFLQKHPNDNI